MLRNAHVPSFENIYREQGDWDGPATEHGNRQVRGNSPGQPRGETERNPSDDRCESCRSCEDVVILSGRCRASADDGTGVLAVEDQTHALEDALDNGVLALACG